jgi:DNA repair protein RecO (recombination protein O)
VQRVEGQPAFVRHAQPYRETSLLVETFTRDHGRTGLVARGVRGARGQPLRALLQPLQPLLIDCSGTGDLMRLAGAEAAGAAFAPQGDALLAGFYLNELLLRLLPRGEALPSLFWRYTQTLAALQADGDDWIWQLRRFERDLLAGLGYALQLGGELEPQAHYRYDPENGPLRLARAENASVSGAALLALARDEAPASEQLRELRALMRRVLLHHLGGRELKSWRVFADLAGSR